MFASLRQRRFDHRKHYIIELLSVYIPSLYFRWKAVSFLGDAFVLMIKLASTPAFDLFCQGCDL
jgi:hypothetical protein